MIAALYRVEKKNGEGVSLSERMQANFPWGGIQLPGYWKLKFTGGSGEFP